MEAYNLQGKGYIMLVVSRGYSIAVDYKKTILDMIADYQYLLSPFCSSLPSSNIQLIPEDEKGSVFTEVFLADFDCDATPCEVIRQTEKLKFRGANFEELLTFGYAFADVCQERSVIALAGLIGVPHIGLYASSIGPCGLPRQRLMLNLLPLWTLSGRRFLVVPES